jgi:ferritin-like metal-binding protein YciE
MTWPQDHFHPLNQQTTKPMRTLKHLFLEELADRYDAEKRLVIALPKMIKAATCTHLQELIQSHLKETIGHVKTLEKVFRSFGEEPRAKKCGATVGLLKEGDEVAADNQGCPALNAALISIAQKLEHYEIASYGCLRGWARLLGNTEAAGLLQEVLVEEKAANHALSELARFRSNNEALGECAATDFYSDGKDAKPLNGRRDLRPLNPGRAGRILMSSR